MRLIVGGLPVAHHSHNVGKRDTRSVILVGIDEDAQTLELVCRSEDRALCGALLGEPEGEAIAVQVALAVDFEFELDLYGVRITRSTSDNWMLTCQLVAVKGTREKIHPCCDGRSAVRRIDLQRAIVKAGRMQKGARELTYQPEPPCPLRSRTSGFGNPNQGMAVAGVNKGVFSLQKRAQAWPEEQEQDRNYRRVSYRRKTVGSKLIDQDN